MGLLIKNGYVLTLDADDRQFERADIFIEGNRIAAVGPDLDIPSEQIERVIDARHKLVMPGFINAHMHTGEGLARGIVAGLPNELWNLWSYPSLHAPALTARLHYLRTIIEAIEMIKSGVTTVQDHSRDWFLAPDTGSQEAYFGAYEAVGLRLSLAINVIDRPWHETFTDLAQRLPTDLLAELTQANSHWNVSSVQEITALCEATLRRWHGHQGRITVALGPAAPQRCTQPLLERIAALAQAHAVPIHTHLLETRIQAEVNRRQYNGSMVDYLHQLGLLGPRTTLAHAIWLTDHDLDRLGETGCCVAHNPTCNLLLGSGVMPFARLVERGVPLALGLDGVASTGRLSMFEAMKFAALLHTVTTADYRRWPTADQVLRMATQGGARSAGLASELGQLSPGFLADIILLDMTSLSFTPLNHLKNQLVFSESGASVETVIINGALVLHERRLVTVDEAALMDEFRACLPEYQAQHKAAIAASARLFPGLEAVYQDAVQNAGVDRG